MQTPGLTDLRELADRAALARTAMDGLQASGSMLAADDLEPLAGLLREVEERAEGLARRAGRAR